MRHQSSERTLDELILAYMEHVQQYYVKDGRPTSSQEEARRSLLPLHETYGTLPCSDFGPLAFKALRQSLIDRGWSRPTINKATSIIKRMFKGGGERTRIR